MLVCLLFQKRFLAVASLKSGEAVRKLGSFEDRIPSGSLVAPVYPPSGDYSEEEVFKRDEL